MPNSKWTFKDIELLRLDQDTPVIEKHGEAEVARMVGKLNHLTVDEVCLCMRYAHGYKTVPDHSTYKRLREIDIRFPDYLIFSEGRWSAGTEMQCMATKYYGKAKLLKHFTKIMQPGTKLYPHDRSKLPRAYVYKLNGANVTIVTDWGVKWRGDWMSLLDKYYIMPDGKKVDISELVRNRLAAFTQLKAELEKDV